VVSNAEEGDNNAADGKKLELRSNIRRNRRRTSRKRVVNSPAVEGQSDFGGGADTQPAHAPQQAAPVVREERPVVVREEREPVVHVVQQQAAPVVSAPVQAPVHVPVHSEAVSKES
jgi:hypothetical protein